jgi:hypothetical protein
MFSFFLKLWKFLLGANVFMGKIENTYGMMGRDKITRGIILGAVAGVIDVIPMALQNLTWDANISAFALWVVSGFMIATSSLNLKGYAKGVLISFLVLIPSLILIAWKDQASAVPIGVMTLILGSLLGHMIGKKD